ncbi:MAG: prenyltransferase/squalene oxidase repeat-containing protein [Kiritimatiellia bacterium]
MEQEEEVIEAIDLEAIAEKYEAKGYFRRLADMFRGLGQPPDTAAYKSARIELQRQAAPLSAIVFVVMFVAVTAILTLSDGDSGERRHVQVAEVEEATEVEEVEEEPPPDDIEPPPMEEVDVQVDTPNPGPVTEITPVASPPSAQVSVKPAPQDSVAFVDSPVKMKCMTGSRTPGAIGAATRGGAGYGDATTEACVMKVLWWLKKNQNSDGSWNGRNNLANTALATLTYLAHGEYPGSPSPYQKDFGPVVQKALSYLLGAVNQDGAKVTMRGADGNEYAFLIATYALCEAYGMTKNPNCKDAAYVCLNRIVKGQSPTGGWDYKINPQSTRDDMSFAGWALQALKAGKMAGLHPEGLDACIKKAIHCLKTRNFKNGGFNYTAGGNPTGLTATGCLVMQLLGFGGQSEVTSALDYMRDWRPAFEGPQVSQKNPGPSPQYYCYYATQCKYQAGMKQGAQKKDEVAWQNWNKEMKLLYPKSIIDDPEPVKDWSGKDHKQGHFVNKDAETSRPVMDTCLVALQLMVYYRYLPTTQTAAAADVGAADSGAAAVDKGGDVSIEVDI